MKELSYSIQIHAPKEKVWNTMIDLESYKLWVKAFSPNSYFEGQWKQGETVKFIDKDVGGTKAILEIVEPYRHIFAKHIASINKDGSEDTQSEAAQKWIGATEAYHFVEENHVTKLSIDMHAHEDYEKMFNDAWPEALQALKELCEKQ